MAVPHDPAFDFDFAASLDPALPPDAMAHFMSDGGCAQGGMELDLMCLDMLPTPPAAESPPPTAGPESDLHDLFFDIFHPTLPIINRARLDAELAQTPPSLGVEVLSNAIAALGACTVAEHGGRGGRAESHYERARSLLDECEREESGMCLAGINTLQTLRPNCDPAFDKQVAVPLPGPSDFLKDYHVEGSPEGATMPSMQQLFNAGVPLETPVSGFVGNTIMIFLYRQYLYHTRRPRQQGDAISGAFWDSHYSIEKAIAYCRNCLLSHHLGGETQSGGDGEDGVDNHPHPFSSPSRSSSSACSSRGESPATEGGGGPSSLEPVSLIFRTNLDAVEIILHEAARRKAEQDKLCTTLAADASAKAAAASFDVA
ncbi:hypothetical protein RB601_008815 [Gaeumannomyces tritici]